MPSSLIPKVIHLTPDFAATHPYNLQLSQNLRALGVHLKTVKAKIFLKEVLDFHPDILHLHWLHSFIETDADAASAFTCLARIAGFTLQLALVAARGIKIVWTVHELEIPETHYPELDKLCIRLVITLSRAVITHCGNAHKQVASAYCRWSPQKVQVVPHGNFIEVTDNGIGRSASRKALDIPDSKFVVLTFGVIRPYKGIKELIEAHKQLNRPDVLLIIVGGSIMHHKDCVEYLKLIEAGAAASENLRLHTEFIPDERIQIYMNASDVVAFPYRAVMTSGALIMAMGFGKACIASRIGCMGEILDEQGAFLYESDDKLGLQNALTTCLEKANLLEAMGKHNRDLAERMDWQRIARLTLSVYQGCISGQFDRGDH